ncbi:MAG TPA: dihydrodipicolinate synthase family protein [Terriglobia bacterium]|nr:dihydrodipicolinate synthase family protein [Terriglobia bacterium]
MESSRGIHIDGVIPVVPTPFNDDETIDLGSLHRLIDFARAAGACAVCLPAYASEFYKLSEAERRLVVEEAVKAAAGRILVIGQVNYPSARLAVESALFAQKAGATAIAAAVPRLFSLGERDLFRYFDRLLKALDIPLIIQDFNPGGPTIGPDFIAGLHQAHPHFRYVKLEDPLMGKKIKAILDATQGEVGVIEGWGGMYMMELIPVGICGIMPGLALTDFLSRVFKLMRQGLKDEAYSIFRGVLPQIVFSLQHMELFHYAEKMLLQARGILPRVVVRELRMEIDKSDQDYIVFLNQKVLELLDHLKMPYNPAVGA